MLRGSALLSTDVDGAAGGVHMLAERLAARNIEIIPSIFLHAESGGRVQHSAYLRYREMIVEDYRAARPVDAILLFLHGAMVSTECLDCEGDLLARLRDVAGADIPIGVMLDPHAHLTERMVRNATIMAFMKEYPHTDGNERMSEVVEIVGKVLDGKIHPVASVADCRVIGLFPTNREPMRGFVDHLFDIEKREGILSASFVHGFPWGDTPDTGAKALVYANGHHAAAARTADEIRTRLWSICRETMPPLVTPDDMIALIGQPGEGPILFADLADNPGGGAPSDSTFLLRALIEAGAENVGIGFSSTIRRRWRSAMLSELVGVSGFGSAARRARNPAVPIDLDAEVRGVARDAKMSAFGFLRCRSRRHGLDPRRRNRCDTEHAPPAAFRSERIFPSRSRSGVV